MRGRPWREWLRWQRAGGLAPCFMLLALLGGCDDAPAGLPGSLEWDRLALPAEASEPVRRWTVHKGERVAAGQLLLELDGRRLEAEREAAKSQVDEAEALLAELRHGPRTETLAAARAELDRARAEAHLAELSLRRQQALFERRAAAEDARDAALAERDRRRAEAAEAAAHLAELEAGTRAERLDQAEAAAAAARHRLESLTVSRERLIVRAPRPGRVDALPFRPGDQPPAGATLVSLLVGEAPYARFFVPAGRRASLDVGDALRVHVEGIAEPFDAVLEHIRREPAFTPFYALSGEDASRLVYRAEGRLSGERARTLPAGLPVRVEIVDDGER
ncbi:HlyD family secretion protein [Halomonas getboli]|uniref:HlyD family secretion protein n=1 Tax=Halomonas getboli TaxID=2935862 RepID=UPI001FFF471D|nr:HlyD family efflux transporter periplasmic adaptor subunit [Halomonas getboli]MCK2184648.1 HlyD family efflux transporter periplasmic adaptor subunit [Halomonas getboli]